MSDIKRTITPNDPADFTPTREPQIPLQPFRYWCQKVLPLVYDDSLSYYELLCKVVDYLNKTMENVEHMDTDITNLYTAYSELQSYVNNYFSTLDVQEEINNKLDQMFKDGQFNILLNLFIPYVTPEMFGAVGDGETDDTAHLIAAFNNKDKLPVILRGTYKVSTLNITNAINISGGTIISDSTAMIYNAHVRESKIKGVTFIATDVCLEIQNSDHITIENCTFKNATNAVRITGGVECKMLNCYITCDEIGGSTGVGLFINSSDGEYSNINIVDYKTGVSLAGYNVLNTIHPWTWSKKVMLNSVAFHCRQGCRSVITNCYCDSFEYGIFFEDTSYMTVSKLFYFWNSLVFTGKKVAFLFNTANIARLINISDINVNSDDPVLFSNIGYPENNENQTISMNRCFVFNNTLREPFQNTPTNEPEIETTRNLYNMNSYLVKDFCLISFTFTPTKSDLNNQITLGTITPKPAINFHARFIGKNKIVDASIINGVITATFTEIDDYIINLMFKF